MAESASRQGPRYPVRIKVYGGSLALLPPGTDWRVERIAEHVAEGGLIGEVMPEWTIIDLRPIEAAEAASLSQPTVVERLAVALHEERVDRWGRCGNSGESYDDHTTFHETRARRIIERLASLHEGERSDR